MTEKTSLLVNGLTTKHKDFLQRYAQKKLGSPARTKAILSLIEKAMLEEDGLNNSIIINNKLRNTAINEREKYIEEHQQKLQERENKINRAMLSKDNKLLKKIYKNKITLRKQRIQLSIPIYDYNFLQKLANDSGCSIQYYMTVILNDYLYGERKLLGYEIEALKRSNYELYKIGVNVNQIAKANNAGDMVELPIHKLYNFIQKHVSIVQKILNKSTDIY